ncbi:hypothetical protein [Rufibacter hautae]|uniref:Outer membrane protein beta-barrel domain-containing protein n=1 Tax=Rufibacter hautae TaxID=2595005 RepID=A0A5B6TL81_9BACT|nr:hypothetical protein [Rufibacter hautae]KAA3436852.1 hypothetical protein FOA19_20980 [Rufibacter hautae]
MKYVFEDAYKLTLTASGGITVMNSDYQAGNVGIIEKAKIKGYGYNFGLGAMYQFSPYIGGMVNLDYLTIKGKRPEAGCSFCSEMVTGTISGVMLLATRATLTKLYSRSFRRGIFLVPYLRGGVGFMSYQAYSYRSEQSENPVTDYPGLTMVIPAGGGLRIRVTDQISLATEAVVLLPFSDYLDNRTGAGNFLGGYDQLLSFSLKGLYYLGSKRSSAVNGSVFKKFGFKKKK